MSEIENKLDGLRIERPEPSEDFGLSKGPWLAAGLVLLIALILAGWWFSRPTVVAVTTAVAREIQTGSSQTVLNASGYVNARRRATVSSKVTGKVIEVMIEEGMAVEEGQILARLDASNVDAAYQLSTAQLEQAKTQLEETRVLLAQAKLDLERARNLQRDQIASQSELDLAKAQADSLAARLESQRESVSVAQRQVALNQQFLEDTVIRAPFAGIVVAKNAQPGEMISPAAAGGGFTRSGIGTVVDMSSLEIEVDVNEAYINRVRPGQRVSATLDAYPDWEIPASVIAIIPTADRQKATVQVRIAFDELDPRVLPDMGVKVAFRSDPSDDTEQSQGQVAVVLPRTALRKDGGSNVVFVVQDGHAERRAVSLGESDDKSAEVWVLSGVSAGERVVLEGPAELVDGDQVEEVS